MVVVGGKERAIDELGTVRYRVSEEAVEMSFAGLGWERRGEEERRGGGRRE